MYMKISLKCSLADTMVFEIGKGAGKFNRGNLDSQKATDLSFWARGCCVGTVGSDEATVSEYIHNQEKPRAKTI